MPKQGQSKPFGQFHDPDVLYATLTQDTHQIPNVDFFSRPRYKKPQEACIAALFARGFTQLVTPCTVRPVDTDQFPDFQICLAGKVYDFECTERQQPDRKRGKEYK